MRKLNLSFLIVAFIALTVNGQDELEHAMTSRESVMQSLGKMNVQIGGDLERGRIAAIGTSGFYMKGGESDGELGLNETYDFPDDATDDFETKRFKAVWKAYANGLAEIAYSLGTSVEQSETKAKSGKILSQASKSSAVQSLAGVVTITMAESCSADGEYEVTVAVCQSQKRAEAYSRGLNGGDAKPGNYTIAEFVKQKSESGCGMICPQSYCDNEGVWWRIAGVPVDLSAGRNSKKVAVLTVKAKRYAYEAAMRSLAVRVSANTSMSVNMEGGKEDESLNETSVKIEPINTILPVDRSQVRWFELDGVNPLTGKPVRCLVAALRSGNGRGDEKVAPVPKEKQVAHESVAVMGLAADGRRMDAFDQALAFLKKAGLMQGYDEERKKCILISSKYFDYEKTMSDEEFARKRYLEVQRAFVRGCVEIAQLLKRKTDDFGREGRVHGLGREYFMLGRFVDEEADEGWIPQLKRMMDRKFSWKARLVGSRGKAMMECPMYGLSIVRQFESLSEGVYHVALIVSLDVENGKNEIMSFVEDRAGKPGEMSLKQWMDTQDFGMVAGPRRFVDNEGTIWAIGIVPAAEGQQPYGTLLDAAARECAAFALGGDLAVSIHAGNWFQKTTETDYEMWNVEPPNDTGLIEFKAVGVDDWYPRELEQYFHRTYTHPLTGRKGVAAICALRSGASRFNKELQVRKIKKMRERQYEKGMRARMLDTLKGLAKELDDVKTDDARYVKMKRKINGLINSLAHRLQDERSVRPKCRKQTEERLAEIMQKIEELKGSKSNENQ